MSYGLNMEMHKQVSEQWIKCLCTPYYNVLYFSFPQTEIAKRLNAICAQVIPFLSQEHQQQVAAAVERAKQVTTSELHAIIGVSKSV